MFDNPTAPSPATPAATPSAAPVGAARIAVRWMVSFVGFPLGGLAALVLTGPVDDAPAALLGGLITGTILGGVQARALDRRGRSAAHWAAATALGLSAGLGIGAAAVGFATSLSALLVQGAVSGFGVGAAQSVLLRAGLGRLAPAWPLLLALIWAIGWAVTVAFGVRVEDQFTVFGSSGALVVTALAAVLPVALARAAANPR